MTVIYLIGGPPRCGKTTLACRLAQRTGASCVSLDAIQSVVYHYLSDTERVVTHPLFPEATIEARYAAHTADEIIANYQMRARSIWPAIHVLIHFALAADQNVILEGYHLEPRFCQEFMSPDSSFAQPSTAWSMYQAMMVQRGTGYALRHADDPRIKAVFLYREDVDTIATSLTHVTASGDWLGRQMNTKLTLRRIARMVSQYSHYIRTEANQNGGMAINMDRDFEQQIEQIITGMTD
jgi:hypothetical protein